MADPGSFNFQANELPYNWDPYRALPIADVLKFLNKHLRPDLPIKSEHMLAIFFHETGFCNVRQNQGKGPAVGFGQVEIFNPDKIPFFQTLNYNSAVLNPRLSQKAKEKYSNLNTLLPLTYESVLNDNEFAVRMHCAYFAWLFDEGIPTNAAPGQKGIRSLTGLLQAQTGGGKNGVFVKHFIDSGVEIKNVINSGDRQKIIDALNTVRHYLKKDSADTEQRTLTLKRYPKYWDYILPESDVRPGGIG